MTDRGTSVNLRDLALEAILLVLEEGQYSHLVIRQALEKYGFLSAQEKSFFVRLMQGTIERKIELDWILSQYSKIPPDKMKPVIRNILRLTAYQLYYMDAVPVSAACNEAVKLAGKRGFSGLKGFINGVSRSVARGKDTLQLPEDPVIRYSMPEWIIEKFTQCAGRAATEESLQNLLLPDKNEITVHCHTSRACISDIIQSLHGQGVQVRKDAFLPDMLHLKTQTPLPALQAFRNGLIQVQNVSSALACMAAAVLPGSFCMDVCAAPGGKSIYLADRMQNSGQILSRDISDDKLSLIDENVRRCGFSCIRTQLWDAAAPDPGLYGKADLVFADLPCSGLGVIGSKPDIKYHQTPEGAVQLAALQRQILTVVQEYVKPGGILLYSTCTVNPDENIRNRDWFLGQFPFETEDLTPLLPDSIRADSLKEGYLQLMPGDFGADGFFFSRMRRRQ